MYCKKCGKQIYDDSKYSKHCGISLTILVRYIVKFGKWVATNKSN